MHRPLILDLSGDKPVGEVGVGELSDTTEGEGSLLGPDEHRQLALRVRQHGLDILESYPQPSYKAGVVLIPEDKRDSVDITGIVAQSSLAEIAQGLNLLMDDALNIESPRLTHVSTHRRKQKVKHFDLHYCPQFPEQRCYIPDSKFRLA